jgi:hypothetical protein
MICHLKGCPRCDGDLVFDEGDWRCWQCGHYYYTWRGQPLEESLARSQPATPRQEEAAAPVGAERRAEGDGKRRRGYGARSARNINSVIRAKVLSDRRWGDRNRQIIQYLDEGLSIREIARRVGRGERQIRVVKERLADLRAAGEQA